MAREAKAEARRLFSQGVDPSEKRKADKRAAAAARTFGEVADEWFETKREREAKSEATLKRNRWLMGEWKSEIGRRPIGEIEPLSKENLSWRGCCPLRNQELAMMETYRLEQTTQFVLVDLLVSPVSIWKK